MAQSTNQDKAARILVADAPVPSPHYGSWVQRIDYLLQHFSENCVNYLICSKTNVPFRSENTKRYGCPVASDRMIRRIFPHWRLRHYKRALQEIAHRHGQLVICIIDSIRAKQAIVSFVEELGISSRCRIIYYQCGFSTYLPSPAFLQFIKGIHAAIYLSMESYDYELRHNPELPFEVHVLPNPIDHRVYHKVSQDTKKELQTELGYEANKLHFVWSSVNRPKKGLAIVLKAWQMVYSPAQSMHLHVLGTASEAPVDGVTFHGFVPPPDVHRFLKAGDIGLFSALWPEGFGLSLAEQISCGLFCIASVAGGPASYFDPQKHGIAIKHPNVVSEWTLAFEKVLTCREEIIAYRQSQSSHPSFLTYDAWCRAFCQILK
jgi:glycosyltransferase involved in cell wall biosynthesis